MSRDNLEGPEIDQRRIAILVTGEIWGGTERHSCCLASALQSRGHQVNLVCLTESAHQTYRQHSPSGANVVANAIPKHWNSMSMLDWRRHLAAINADTAIFAKGEYDSGGLKFDLAARSVFKSYLTIEHLAADPFPKRSSRRHFGAVPGLGLWWYKQRMKTMLRAWAPHRTICVSDAVRQRLLDDYHFAPKKTVTIRNGTDTERFRPDPVMAVEMRDHWGIPHGCLVLGAICRFAPVKAIDVAIRAFHAAVKSTSRDIRLVLVGEGECEALLRQLAASLSLNDKVVFAPFTSAPWKALAALDIFLMPSKNEGLPLALLEAMASGCCPIATDVGGTREVLINPDYGWLVPADDEDAFQRAMTECIALADSDRLAISGNAQHRILNGFAIANRLTDLAKVIESC